VKVKKYRPEVIMAAVSQQPKTKQQQRRTANRVRNDARAIAPVLTGDLRRSLTVWEEHDPVTKTTEYRVGWDLDIAIHGWMVEAGTEHSAARPHLRPAAIKNGGRPPLSGGV
jgi:hypothetical protein